MLLGVPLALLGVWQYDVHFNAVTPQQACEALGRLSGFGQNPFEEMDALKRCSAQMTMHENDDPEGLQRAFRCMVDAPSRRAWNECVWKVVGR